MSCSAPTLKTPETVPVHEVINAVKDQLLTFYTSPVLLMRAAPTGAVCKSPTETNEVTIKPKAAKLILKTVATRAFDQTAGLAAPLGVFKIDPNFSAGYSRGNTQSLEVDFDFVAVKSGDTRGGSGNAKANHAESSEDQLRLLIAGMGKELLEVDNTKAPCIKPTDIKSVVYFDVVTKGAGGFGIEIVGLKLGSKVTVTDEFHQVLEIDFSLEGSSPLAPR